MSEIAVRTESLTTVDRGGTIPPIDAREVWRYAGYRGMPGADEEVSVTLMQVIEEIEPLLTYRVCHCEIDLLYRDGIPQPPFSAQSISLARVLNGCERIVLFAVTIGIELDRRIAKYSRVSPLKALLLQAIGAERVEALADTFCNSYKTDGCTQTRRFSPGYGDLPLSVQTDFIRILDCGKRIGITLNESLLMSPSKSVTAVFGLKPEVKSTEHPYDFSKCAECNDLFCEYRRKDFDA